MKRRNRGAWAGGLLLMLLAPLQSAADLESTFYASPGIAVGADAVDECRDIVRLPTPLDAYCETDPLVLGWKQYGGWRVAQSLSLEGGYARLDHSDRVAAGSTAPGSMLFAGIAGGLQLTPSTRGSASVGMALESDLSTGLTQSARWLRDGSSDSVQSVFGLAAERRLGKQVSGRLAWERYDFDQAVDTVFASIVLRLGANQR